jgi:hypothetical protein
VRTVWSLALRPKKALVTNLRDPNLVPLVSTSLEVKKNNNDEDEDDVVNDGNDDDSDNDDNDDRKPYGQRGRVPKRYKDRMAQGEDSD